jgi:hypothetical protein
MPRHPNTHGYNGCHVVGKLKYGNKYNDYSYILLFFLRVIRKTWCAVPATEWWAGSLRESRPPAPDRSPRALPPVCVLLLLELLWLCACVGLGRRHDHDTGVRKGPSAQQGPWARVADRSPCTKSTLCLQGAAGVRVVFTTFPSFFC